MIAGHTFADTAHGRRCTSCNARWCDVISATRADIGQLHIAHVGALTEAEWGQIEAERDRVFATVTEAALS